MTLLAPGLAIAGILAAAVPIVIHLLLRRRRRPVEWAAMSLLMQAVRRHRRRARIERVLYLWAPSDRLHCFRQRVSAEHLGEWV